VGSTVSLGGAALVFTPTTQLNGPASFYTVSDGNGGTATAVDVTVTPVNDAPVANAEPIRHGQHTGQHQRAEQRHGCRQRQHVDIRRRSVER
jgi:hypothetical protein